MDEHGGFEVGTATGVDYEVHRRTYDSFLRVTRWGIVGVVLILVVLALWYRG
jgi:hypothetical protein